MGQTYSRARLYHTRVFRIIVYMKQSKHPLENHIVFLYRTPITFMAGTLDVANEDEARPGVGLRRRRAHSSGCGAGRPPSQHTRLRGYAAKRQLYKKFKKKSNQ
ncbi:hypothetical protein IscW_ISCW021271 [Ixodes scapularis]|uniref:Uncharacterized protein n=1 Tax=Ixodes scapularis TaxID=6945 RepID=B7Q666_IXOSC|nr:hypothetical protein IscW_ISCW021271 [Ixodes scapularis]|eukprot:XP_002402826.1 hypothetical protein IscW_ISCW021271 [Ixodes scapularis]